MFVANLWKTSGGLVSIASAGNAASDNTKTTRTVSSRLVLV